MEGKIIKGIGGFYYIKTSEGIIECKARGKFRHKDMKPMVGDNVTIEVMKNGKGVIEDIHERKSELIRPTVANITLAFVVFAVKNPDLNFDLLNRFLVLCENNNIEPVVCLNKVDLVSEEERESFKQKINDIGYEVLFIKAKDGEGIESLRERMKGNTTVLCGPSGVGKSTLINIILGNNKQYSGSVKYNDVEISDIEESQLFKSVSYIGNITHIYHDSLRNNLTLWDNKINESEIINILKQVNLIDLIPRLDDEVSMSFLSEGQKQRLGIARAYLTKTNVIIMDESMANLDRDNAFLIENQLLNDPTRMYITVSHHLQEKLLDRFHSIITL